jgi:hypothetical protein
MELPDANLVATNQTLSGIVVDVDGNPLSGIRVNAQLQNGGGVPGRNNKRPPVTETDGNGRFRLEQLPDEDLSLMACQLKPGGNQIRLSTNVDVERNQSDIRIVFDLTLLTEVEDLDAK